MNSLAVHAESAGKRFGREWVFRDFSQSFHTANSYAILGQNGSGKSTLLLAISGYYRLSAGTIQWKLDDTELPEDQSYQHYSLISPLLELPEELSILEFWQRHFSLKPMKKSWSFDRMLEESGLQANRHKHLKQLSSGMLQRVKLMSAFAADVPVVLLDEPCTNLDKAGIDQYQKLVAECGEQLLVVASNMEAEYGFAREQLHIESFKKRLS